VLARLRADAASVTEIYLDEERKDARAKDLASPRKKPALAHARSDQALAVSTAAAATRAWWRWRSKTARQGLEDLLDSVRKRRFCWCWTAYRSHNLGACLRVADAAGPPRGDRTQDRAAGISAAVTKWRAARPIGAYLHGHEPSPARWTN